jgi:RNA polymerase sigma-70 factor (ECF subfamily)
LNSLATPVTIYRVRHSFETEGAAASGGFSASAPAAASSSGDAALVAAARAGDRAAFGTLHDIYSRMIHGILLSRVPPREADDLAQDVFLLAMRKIHSLRDGAAFGPWLATIARNRAKDFHRFRFRDGRETEVQAGDASDIADIARESPPHAEAAEVLDTLKSLPEAYRETLVLRLVEGMSGPEIAERTGLTPASVRVNLHRGMKLLRQKLGLGEVEP